MPDRTSVDPARVAAPAAAAAQLADLRLADLARVHVTVVGQRDRGRQVFGYPVPAVPSTRALIHAPWSASKVVDGAALSAAVSLQVHREAPRARGDARGADRQGDPQGARARADGDADPGGDRDDARRAADARSSRGGSTRWPPGIPAFTSRHRAVPPAAPRRAPARRVLARGPRGPVDDAVLQRRRVLPRRARPRLPVRGRLDRARRSQDRRAHPGHARSPISSRATRCSRPRRSATCARSGSASTGSPSARSSGATPVPPETVIDRLVPDLLDNIEAAALAVDDGPRPNPGPWCDRCSYRELCPASRELRYEPVEYYEDDED